MNKTIGQHWVLLRGLARESGHWGEFVPQLQNRFPKAKITLLDLPGTGRYYQQKSPYSITQITEQVRIAASEQGLLEQPITLLAVSLGAMVGWQWLNQYPKEICGAVLINTSLANLSPFYQRMRWSSSLKLLALLLQSNLSKREQAIVKLVSNRQECYQTITAQWTAIQSQRPIHINNCLRQLLAAATYKPDYNIKPTQPILLLNGLGDRLVSPQCSMAIQKKWQIPLQSHPWAGHDLTLDDSQWVLEQLSHLLDSN